MLLDFKKKVNSGIAGFGRMLQGKDSFIDFHYQTYSTYKHDIH